MERKHKIICPDCKGNGFIRVDYALAREEMHAKCETCNYEGEIVYDEPNVYECNQYRKDN